MLSVRLRIVCVVFPERLVTLDSPVSLGGISKLPLEDTLVTPTLFTISWGVPNVCGSDTGP